VSSGSSAESAPEQITVPDVKGLYMDEAAEAVYDAGLKVGMHYKPQIIEGGCGSATSFAPFQPGTVLAQHPHAGAVLDAGVQVVLVVAGDPGPARDAHPRHFPNLVVIDGSWRRWNVVQIQRLTPRGKSIDAYYEAGPPGCTGFVGYDLEWHPGAVIVRLVEGRNAEFCNAIGYPTTYSVPLDRPLGDRKVLPQFDGESGAVVVHP